MTRTVMPHCNYDVALMVRVGVRRLRDGLSRYLKRVARGERIVVTEHDRPVAALGPVAESDEDRVLLDLVREGRAEWGGGKPEGARRTWPGEGALRRAGGDRRPPVIPYFDTSSSLHSIAA